MQVNQVQLGGRGIDHMIPSAGHDWFFMTASKHSKTLEHEQTQKCHYSRTLHVHQLFKICVTIATKVHVNKITKQNLYQLSCHKTIGIIKITAKIIFLQFYIKQKQAYISKIKQLF